jgi:hypothetical protein
MVRILNWKIMDYPKISLLVEFRSRTGKFLGTLSAGFIGGWGGNTNGKARDKSA